MVNGALGRAISGRVGLVGSAAASAAQAAAKLARRDERGKTFDKLGCQGGALGWLRAACRAAKPIADNAGAPKSPRRLLWAPLESTVFDFHISAASKPDLYAQLIEAADAVTAGEPDAVANMANLSSLIMEALPDLNWAGFYRNVGGELVLRPFQGRAACIRIPFGKGVCGTAAATLQPQCVADVHAFPGHIACDSASASELVVPVVYEGRMIGVLDLDSPTPGRFDEEDVAGCVELVRKVAARLAA